MRSVLLIFFATILFARDAKAGAVPCIIGTYSEDSSCFGFNKVTLTDFTTCRNTIIPPGGFPANQASFRQIPSTNGECLMKVYTGRDCVTEIRGYESQICSTFCTAFRVPGISIGFSCRQEGPTGAPTTIPRNVTTTPSPTIANGSNVTSGAVTKSLAIALYAVIFVTPWSWFKWGGGK